MNMKKIRSLALVAAGCLAFVGVGLAQTAKTSALKRDVLPVAEPKLPFETTLDARNAKAPPRFDVKAPAGAPNVVVVLIDDMGFGAPSAFGGPVQMPTSERLAKNGLRYNQFHTTALCSPTRAALLTGRNHHQVNMGSITELATAFPGNTGQRPGAVAPVAEMLRLNGFSTAAFGKSHETAAWEVSPSGPTDRWPTRSGFDKFYGFIGGEANQWAPTLYDGMTRIETPRKPGYNFMTDMTDQAINWARYQKSLTPDRPFFMYFAPGATHAPHHVPKEWIAKYKGRFDAGWDKLREETLARQISSGVVPAGTQLAPKPEAIKDWDKLTDTERKLFARQMEVYAGFAEYADTEIGRLVDAIDGMGQLDNTLIFYILGDNGASAEGGMVGLANETSYFNGIPESVDEIMKKSDELGGPSTYPHMAAGWAVALSTPFSWTKQVASNYGGTRNSMIVHWPQRIKPDGLVRSQFHHVVDVAPTILDVAQLPQPKSVNGVIQIPFDGVSMAYTFAQPAAVSQRKVQYFEIFGNRAIYADGWFAGTVHRAPWEGKPRTTLDQDKWELYDTRKDFSLRTDLAAANPGKLKEMQKIFMSEAAKNRALPIDDRTVERFSAETAGRPDLMMGRTSLTVYEGMVGMSENVFINIKNRSLNIAADIESSGGRANGVILAQGGQFGGWTLYTKDGYPIYEYNYLGKERFVIKGRDRLPKGQSTLVLDFAYDGGGLGKGGKASLSINGKQVADGRIEKTHPSMFSGDETADVGMDDSTPVSQDYPKDGSHFTDKILKVAVKVGTFGAADHQGAG